MKLIKPITPKTAYGRLYTITETGTLNPYSIESEITLNFFSFDVIMKNKMNENKEICFNLKVIENGIKIREENVDKRISLKPNMNVQETVLVNRVQTHGDGYVEIKLFECDNPFKIYATGYIRY